MSLQIVKKNKGQVAIEYVLLIVIISVLGSVILRSFVSRNADEPGIIVAKWNNLLKTVAEDNPEE